MDNVWGDPCGSTKAHADGAAREIRYPLALAGHAFATMCEQWVRSKRFSRRSLLDASAGAVSERAAAESCKQEGWPAREGETPGCDRICGLSPGTACLQTNQTLSCRVGPSLQSRPSFADRHPERQPRGKVWRQCGETNAPCCRGLSAHTLPLSGPGLRRAPGSARQKQTIH